MRDFDRPLDETGRAEAVALARRLDADDIKAATVFCSPALRTRQTAEIVLEGTVAITFIDRLYSADAHFYLDTARQAHGADTAIIVGHNPMTEELALALAKQGSSEALNSLRGGYPTCGLAVFTFEGSFYDIAPERTYLEDFVRPRA